MRISLLFKITTIASIVVIFSYYYFNLEKPIKTIGSPDQCVTCHIDYGSIDKAHPVELFGCASCHGGNQYATTKEDAHVNIVKNPSSLENVDRFCSKCHDDVIPRVKQSLMESQQGIKDVLEEQWVHKSSGLNDKNLAQELVDSHFSKACASCHINQKEEVFYDQSLAKGGGCADCHRVVKSDGKKHSEFSTKIPSQTCLKCHNRSNRIGPSYFGKFESEGYGTPFHDGNFTHKLDSTRFYYDLPADIHHEKADLDCIDCHTEKGVMGDGKENPHMEDAVDISCQDCHAPVLKELLPNTLASKLIDLNENVPTPKKIAYTNKKNSPIYNLQQDTDNNVSFYRKKDGEKFDLTKTSNAPYHTLDIHKRLDCTACHSQWIASCYGCHDVYFDDKKQYDWTTNKVTDGRWMELRSFLRYESPALGVGYNEKIMPFAPGCQVIGTIFKDDKIEQFHAMAMAGWDPHTTGKSRTCVDCHTNPASLGLGKGTLDIVNNEITFNPIYDSKKSGLDISYPIDSFISVEGKQFQTTSREKARGFNKEELHKVIKAYKCILCHRSYDDKIYTDFTKSKILFDKGNVPCLD
jgi:hypothetical protein